MSKILLNYLLILLLIEILFITIKKIRTKLLVYKTSYKDTTNSSFIIN